MAWHSFVAMGDSFTEGLDDRYPDGTFRGWADLVAARLAVDSGPDFGYANLAIRGRKVPQIAFKPDWTKHGKAAPFKRNDAVLDELPIGVMVFPGSGIQQNLRDKARKLGIPVWEFGGA